MEHHHDGGATDIDNLVMLCRHHHGVIHRDGWMMSVATDPHAGGYVEITTPDGTTRPTQHLRPPAPA